VNFGIFGEEHRAPSGNVRQAIGYGIVTNIKLREIKYISFACSGIA
jgi:hypothetical protein